MEQASDLVARMRAKSGPSQRALAERAGRTRSTIVRIEAGEMRAMQHGRGGECERPWTWGGGGLVR
jgi:ribosome-binding protein aMBF1 (putative translation factor)